MLLALFRRLDSGDGPKKKWPGKLKLFSSFLPLFSLRSPLPYTLHYPGRLEQPNLLPNLPLHYCIYYEGSNLYGILRTRWSNHNEKKSNLFFYIVTLDVFAWFYQNTSHPKYFCTKGFKYHENQYQSISFTKTSKTGDSTPVEFSCHKFKLGCWVKFWIYKKLNVFI